MGGRGTFAAGISVDYTYEVDTTYSPDGKWEGVKILKGTKESGEHKLPESSHSSDAYILLDKKGNFREIRFYDKNHCLYLEIAYHKEKSFTGDNHTPILHYHTYDSSFSRTKEGNGGRSKAYLLTDEMKNTYKKYFKGLKI